MDYIFPIAILLVFWFFMIRPQMKQAKKEKKFRSEIKRGDRIVTINGAIKAKVRAFANDITDIE